MPKTKQTLGTRLRELRLAAQLTQQQLADQAGIDRRQVIRLEQDEQRPGLETLAGLARGLGLTPLDLFARLSENGSM